VSVPHLLLVDDSEAILAYETAALSSSYTLTTATNGREALEKLREIRPAAVLLDLSMPEMTGDDLLARMQADPSLRRIPVIIVSSETARGESSTRRGARAFLAKPIRATELQVLVARVLEEERIRARGDELAVLFLGVGTVELGIPLDPVREILPQSMTQAVPGPVYLSEMIHYRGRPALVLDLALRLEIANAEPFHERKLVVVQVDDWPLAIAVDGVRAPEAFAAHDVLETATGAGDPGSGIEGLLAFVRTPRGAVPVVEPKAFLSVEPLRRLSERLTRSDDSLAR